MVERRVGYQVADVLTDGAVADEGPVQERTRPSDRLIRFLVQKSRWHTTRGIVSAIRTDGRWMHAARLRPRAALAGSCGARGAGPRVVVVEQRPVDRLASAVVAKEASAEPRVFWKRRS